MEEVGFKISQLDKDAPDYGRAIGLSNARIKAISEQLDELKVKHVKTGAYNSLTVLIDAINTIPKSIEELVFLSLSYGYNVCEMEHKSPLVKDFVAEKKRQIEKDLKNKGT